jgi:hypothetical protein
MAGREGRCPMGRSCRQIGHSALPIHPWVHPVNRKLIRAASDAAGPPTHMQPRLSGTCMHARSVTVECSMRSVCFLVKVLAPFVFHLRMGFFSTPTFLLRASVGLLDRGTYLENNLTVTQGTCITDKGTDLRAAGLAVSACGPVDGRTGWW